MEIKIGQTAFQTRKPSDLDAALLATTGCVAAEVAAHLGGHPTHGQVAAALRPFLPADAPSIPELASSIAADPGDIAARVRNLYAGLADVQATSSEGAEVE